MRPLFLFVFGLLFCLLKVETVQALSYYLNVTMTSYFNQVGYDNDGQRCSPPQGRPYCDIIIEVCLQNSDGCAASGVIRPTLPFLGPERPFRLHENAFGPNSRQLEVLRNIWRSEATLDVVFTAYALGNGRRHLLDRTKISLSSYLRSEVFPRLSGQWIGYNLRGNRARDQSTFLIYLYFHCNPHDGFCAPPSFPEINEEDPCEPNPCKNGGNCLQAGSRFICNCSPRFAGPICELFVNLACFHEACERGLCEPDPRGVEYFCRCHQGYRGERCEYTIDGRRVTKKPVIYTSRTTTTTTTTTSTRPTTTTTTTTLPPTTTTTVTTTQTTPTTPTTTATTTTTTTTLPPTTTQLKTISTRKSGTNNGNNNQFGSTNSTTTGQKGTSKRYPSDITSSPNINVYINNTRDRYPPYPRTRPAASSSNDTTLVIIVVSIGAAILIIIIIMAIIFLRQCKGREKPEHSVVASLPPSSRLYHHTYRAPSSHPYEGLDMANTEVNSHHSGTVNWSFKPSHMKMAEQYDYYHGSSRAPPNPYVENRPYLDIIQ